VAVGFFIADKTGHVVPAHWSLIATIAATTVVWVSVAYLTAPTPKETLISFYKLVRPAGPGWKAIRAEANLPASPDSLPQSMLGWVLGCSFIYSALFGVGSALYGRTAQAMVMGVVFVLTGFGLLKILPKIWSGKEPT
jgi:hypothetical protein